MNLSEGLTLEIEGHPTEFGASRGFEVYLKGPSQGNDAATGILIVVHNRGEAAGHTYYQELRKDWADQFNVVVVGVNYLGSKASSKPDYRVVFTKTFMDYLASQVPEDLKDSIIVNGEYSISSVLSALIEQEVLSVPELLPMVNDNQTPEEYWDFGFIQAMDIIYSFRVVQELCQQNDIPFNDKRAFLYGYGDGGHIVQMCGRLAPNSFALIIDQAGKVMAYPRDLVPQESGIFSVEYLPGYQIKTLVTHPELYSLDPDSDFYITRDMIQIRNLSRLNPYSECKYIMLSHAEDIRSPESSRRYLTDKMTKAGIEVNHVELERSAGDSSYDVDIKESFRKYCSEYIKVGSVNSVSRKTDTDFALGTLLTYETANGKYVIDYSGFVPTIKFYGPIIRLTRNDII
ncbi:MAG: DUF2920 family protein [Acidobacteriota bacterium]